MCLKNSVNLSDAELLVRWNENILWLYFSGIDYFEPQRRGWHHCGAGGMACLLKPMLLNGIG
ncbi:MAG: transposase [Rhodoferax sp.]|nr:transposase [Rhodoferax sp.]